jgi:hypothetical protein
MLVPVSRNDASLLRRRQHLERLFGATGQPGIPAPGGLDDRGARPARHQNVTVMLSSPGENDYLNVAFC